MKSYRVQWRSGSGGSWRRWMALQSFKTLRAARERIRLSRVHCREPHFEYRIVKKTSEVVK